MPELIEKVKRFTLKHDDDEERSVTAVFATLGVVDLDGDIIEAGAIGDQAAMMGAYNHAMNALPPGMGITFETKTEARFTGTFFTTWNGNEHYETLKQAGGQMEWSFRFFVEEGGFETRKGQEYYVIRKAKVTHVAPVESGAGINTRTIEVKSCGPECQAAKAGLTTSAKEVESIDYDRLAESIASALGKVLSGASGPVAASTGESVPTEDTTAKTHDDNPDPGSTDNPSGEPAAKSQTATAQTKSRADGDTHKGQGLGDLIRQTRDEKEVSNEELATATGLSVDTIGGILAGTSGCPKIQHLQNIALRLGVSLSSLVAAAEADGCTEYGGAESSADDQGQDKETGDGEGDGKEQDPETTDKDNAEDTDGPELSDEDIGKQAAAMLAKFRNQNTGIDPGLQAYDEFQTTVGRV